MIDEVVVPIGMESSVVLDNAKPGILWKHLQFYAGAGQ